MKLPAFGKTLLAARAQGAHPVCVQVIFGEDWRPARNDVPLLAMKPESYAPGLYDWRLLAGLDVAVYLRAAQPQSWNDAAFCLMAGEIADWAASVELFFPDGTAEEIALFAWAVKLDNQDDAWPRWWPPARAKVYEQRWKQAFERQTAELAGCAELG